MPLTQLFVDAIHALRKDVPDPGAWRYDERIVRQADRAARSSVPILIHGEAGSGADALARAIHDCGERGDLPFVRRHAAAMTEGAATAIRRGMLEAEEGTFLIQGIEELTPAGQEALLQIVQTRQAGSLNGRRPSGTPGRIIATSQTDLIEKVRSRAFREDLYYRLHILPITLPPLRSRRDLVPGLAHALVSRFAADEGKRITGLSSEAEILLGRYDWPGNLRQLENAVFRAVLLAEGSRLTPAEFPQVARQIQGYRIDIPPLPLPQALQPVVPLPQLQPSASALRLTGEDGGIRSLADLEAEIIRFALSHHRGHISAISRQLGIGRSTLYRKLKDLGLESGLSDLAA